MSAIYPHNGNSLKSNFKVPTAKFSDATFVELFYSELFNSSQHSSANMSGKPKMMSTKGKDFSKYFNSRVDKSIAEADPGIFLRGASATHTVFPKFLKLESLIWYPYTKC